MRFFRISDAADKKDTLLIYGGTGIGKLEGDVDFKLKGKLTDYFALRKNAQFVRYLFPKMWPHTGESTVAYAARLREKAINWDFTILTKEY